MTLKEAINLAITTNPRVRVAYAQVAATQADISAYEAEHLPRVDLDLSGGWQRYDSARTRAQAASVENNSRYRSTSLTLTQPLFDGFAASSKAQQATDRFISAQKRTEEIMNSIAADVVAAYTDVLKFESNGKVIQAQRAFQKRVLEALEQRQRGGIGSSSDVSAVQARISRLDAAISQNLTDKLSAAATFERLVGVPPQELTLPPKLTGVPKTYDDALRLAEKVNPGLKAAGYDVAAVRQLKKARASAFYPQVNLELNAKRDEFVDGDRGVTNDLRALVRLRWNLFAGGGNLAGDSEALARLQEARGRRDIVLIELREQLQRFYNIASQARARIGSLADAVQFTRQTLDSALGQFELNQKTLLEVLDAANENYVTEVQLIANVFTEIFANHRIMALIGTLPDAIGMTPLDMKSEDYDDTLSNLNRFPEIYEPK